MSRSQNGYDGTHLEERLAPVRAVRAVTPLPLSVVIPTLNEARNIGHVLDLMPPVEELIIVDGCSDDGTVQAVREHRPEAQIILQPPAGKGSAMRAGFEIATAPYVVAMDADGSMDPRELPAYAALFELGYDVVKGSRSAVGGDSTDLTLLRRAGNRGLVGRYNTLFRTHLSDLCYGFIGFRRDRLDASASTPTASRSRHRSSRTPSWPSSAWPRCRAGRPNGSTARATCARSRTDAACCAP